MSAPQKNLNTGPFKWDHLIFMQDNFQKIGVHHNCIIWYLLKVTKYLKQGDKGVADCMPSLL